MKYFVTTKELAPKQTKVGRVFIQTQLYDKIPDWEKKWQSDSLTGKFNKSQLAIKIIFNKSIKYKCCYH